MEMSELFQAIHGSMDILTPIKKVDPKTRKSYHIPNMKELQKTADYLECSVDDFYFIPSGLHPLFYFKDYVFVEIFSTEIAALEMMKLKDRIKGQHEYVENLITEKKFSQLFVLIDKKFRFWSYKNLYNLIPDEDKYEIFIDIYSHGEYGFGMFEPKFLRDIISYRPESIKQEMVDQVKEFANNGILKIYRGVGTKSTSVDKAYSWSLSISIAAFFASRYGDAGKIYEAEVPIEKVIDFIDQRNEDEVLVFPNDLKNVTKLEQVSFEDIYDTLESKGILDKYHDYVALLNEVVPESENNLYVHNKLHSKRVLLLNLILSDMLNLCELDVEILGTAAIYHDIGRTNDREDNGHGYASYKKATHEGFIGNDGAEEDKWLQFIIEQHSESDKNAVSNLPKYQIKNTDKALELLYIFKDCDALDRVRIRDLDVSYLRNEQAKKLILLAYQLLKGIK